MLISMIFYLITVVFISCSLNTEVPSKAL